jgi:toxin ParE1/3/4
MRVVWSARARSRLAEIHAYIAESSKPRASQVIDRLLARSEQLAVAPRSAPRLVGPFDGEIRELLERPFRLVYRVEADQVVILTVKHYRQRLVERPTDL